MNIYRGVTYWYEISLLIKSKIEKRMIPVLCLNNFEGRSTISYLNPLTLKIENREVEDRQLTNNKMK